MTTQRFDFEAVKRRGGKAVGDLEEIVRVLPDKMSGIVEDAKDFGAVKYINTCTSAATVIEEFVGTVNSLKDRFESDCVKYEKINASLN